MVDGNFVFRKIETPEALREAFRLRFEVYCYEAGFIKESDYPNRSESDEFDKDSLHFGAYNSDDVLVGAVRLILPTCKKFPIEEHCADLTLDGNMLQRKECAEISRLVISKNLRRRAHDGMYYEPQIQDMAIEDKKQHFIRRVRPMAFGLYRQMYHESKRIGINHWLALMERSLWLLLKIHGFVFYSLGKEVDFYGKVTPYLANIPELEKNVHQKFPQFFEYFVEGLEPQLQPEFL